MKKFSIKNNCPGIITAVLPIFLAVVLFPGFAAASLSNGTTFTSFFWTQGANDSVKNGCYGYAKIDSVSTGTGRYFSTFWLSKYTWWQKMFTNTYINTAITTSKSKPAAITNAPDHFSNVEWVTGFERNGSKDTLRFYFPLLPQSAGYGKYDYFTVNVNDTVNLEFYGAGDSIMVGSFVHKKPTLDGAVNILARNAFIVELTKANPLRIKSIRCNGAYKTLLNSYLMYNLDTFKKDVAWYGIDITDTTKNIPKIVVHSIGIEGISPLISDSTYKIIWKVNPLTELDSCIVEASFDNKKIWNRIGTTGVDTSFMWKIPEQKSDSTFIKITACGKNGERVLAVAVTRISIAGDPGTSVDGSAGDLNVVPSFSPTACNNGIRINYTLPGRIRELTVSFFDLKGRNLQQVFKQTNIIANKGSFQINSNLNAGYYFIRLHAVFENGQDQLTMSKRWMHIQ